MKKILLVIVLFISLKNAATCQAKLGIIGGVSIAHVHPYRYFNAMNGLPLTSFHAGLVSDLRLSFNLYFQPQFLLSGKGTKDYPNYLDTVTINPFFLEIPLNFLYKNTVGKGNVLVGLGPYVGQALFGKVKTFSSQRNIKFGNKYYDDVRGLDLGLNLIAGYEFKSGPLINVNYSLGLTNSDELFEGARNRYLGISFGYFFNNIEN